MLPLMLPAQRYDSISIVCPGQFTAGRVIPIECRFYNHNHAVFIDTIIRISVNNELVQDVNIRKGVGSLALQTNQQADILLEVDGTIFSKSVLFAENNFISLAGNIGQNLTLEEDVCYHITGDLNIEGGFRLTIEPGARVYIAENANIHVTGQVFCQGNSEKPILFSSLETGKFWGGLIIENSADTSFFKHTFFAEGGGDPTQVFGHSQSQAVVKAANTAVVFEACCFIDNTGKALGALNSTMKITRCLISRCDTGGEFYASSIAADSCHILFIPDADGLANDDDNDAWYFSETHLTETTSTIKNSFFISGEDDGIDHNGANLQIENTWVEGFLHEGIACSNKNSVLIYNSVVTGCGQGIECGYGNPHVEANHCLIMANGTGARFGDEYTLASEGKFQINNTVFFNNTDNLLNFDPQLQGPVGDSLSAHYSITNDPDFDNLNHCLAAVPIFNTDLTLHADSPGAFAANDGLNMGLVFAFLFTRAISQSVQLKIYPNPAQEEIYVVLPPAVSGYFDIILYNTSIQPVQIWPETFFSDGNEATIRLKATVPGMYFLCVQSAGTVYVQKILIYD